MAGEFATSVGFSAASALLDIAEAFEHIQHPYLWSMEGEARSDWGLRRAQAPLGGKRGDVGGAVRCRGKMCARDHAHEAGLGRLGRPHPQVTRSSGRSERAIKCRNSFTARFACSRSMRKRLRASWFPPRSCGSPPMTYWLWLADHLSLLPSSSPCSTCAHRVNTWHKVLCSLSSWARCARKTWNGSGEPKGGAATSCFSTTKQFFKKKTYFMMHISAMVPPHGPILHVRFTNARTLVDQERAPTEPRPCGGLQCCGGRPSLATPLIGFGAHGARPHIPWSQK